jgi:hypothetical protein
MEGVMAEPRREGAHAAKETQRRGDDNRTHVEKDRNREGIAQAAQHRTKRFSEIAREGVRQTADASAAAAARSGSAMADCAQEITAAWARYAEEVMRHSSEASRALLRSRTFSEILEVQAQLLRDNMQAFLDHSVKVAEAASRMAARPFEALRETSSDEIRR